jgi:hypothetical protein
MKNYNKKSKILFDNTMLDKIVNSVIISEQEKMNFIKYLAYLTRKEKKELATLV